MRKMNATAMVFRPRKLVARKPRNRNQRALPLKMDSSIMPTPTAGSMPPMTLSASRTRPLSAFVTLSRALEPKYRMTKTMMKRIMDLTMYGIQVFAQITSLDLPCSIHLSARGMSMHWPVMVRTSITAPTRPIGTASARAVFVSRPPIRANVVPMIPAMPESAGREPPAETRPR